MKKISICLTVALFLLAWASTQAGQWQTTSVKAGVISPQPHADFGRLLFQFDLPDEVAGSTVDYAELVFAATPDTGDSKICLMGVFPISRTWDAAGVSWSETWTNAGGDYVDSVYATAVIPASTDRLVHVDITNIAQLWVDGALPNYGLIAMPLEDSGRFLKLHPTTDLGPNAQAKVRILYAPAEGD